MSAVERIKQILGQREAEAARKQALANAKLAKEQARLDAKAAVQRAQIEAENQKKEERRLFVAKQTEKILRESGVLAELQQIDSEILKGTSYTHKLIYNPNKYRGASLIWGENIKIDEDGVSVSNKHWDANWSYIKVYINPDNEDLFIGEQGKLGKAEWKNKEKVCSMLANVYFHPVTGSFHYEPPEEDDDYVFGGGPNY